MFTQRKRQNTNKKNNTLFDKDVVMICTSMYKYFRLYCNDSTAVRVGIKFAIRSS